MNDHQWDTAQASARISSTICSFAIFSWLTKIISAHLLVQTPNPALADLGASGLSHRRARRIAAKAGWMIDPKSQGAPVCPKNLVKNPVAQTQAFFYFFPLGLVPWSAGSGLGNSGVFKQGGSLITFCHLSRVVISAVLSSCLHVFPLRQALECRHWLCDGMSHLVSPGRHNPKKHFCIVNS